MKKKNLHEKELLQALIELSKRAAESGISIKRVTLSDYWFQSLDPHNPEFYPLLPYKILGIEIGNYY